MLVSSKKLFRVAFRNQYAIGAFNTSNLEITKSIIEAATEKRSPVIIQTTPSAISYAGVYELSSIIKLLARKTQIPVALHLDHGLDLKMVNMCLNHGYTSIMIDGSRFSFLKNVAITRRVVKLAHPRKVGVEGELGTLRGIEDDVTSAGQALTDPDAAVEFVKQTNIDSLAVAIGTSHGAYKFRGSPKLDFRRLKQINDKVDIPLTLHGASGVPPGLVKMATRYGAELGKAEGVPDQHIKKAITMGISKINIDTDLRLAFTAGVRKSMAENPKNIDPRTMLGQAMKEIKEVVKKKISVFGCEGTA